MKLNIIDQIMIAITSVFLFIHIKQVLLNPQFTFSAVVGIWIALSIFDMYARYRRKR